MLAHRDAAPASGRAPLVVIAQGNGQSAADQAVLAELLASHGFVVATSPSQARLGDEMQSEDDILRAARAQAADLAQIVARAASWPFADTSRVAFVAHSFGARSALLAALSEPRTAALVSLDGGIGSHTGHDFLKGAPGLDLAALHAPVLHFYETVDAVMSPDFGLLVALSGSTRRIVRVDGLAHRHFSSFGWAAAAIPALDAPDPERGERCAQVAREALRFLESALRGTAAPAAELPRFEWPADRPPLRSVAGPVGRLLVDDGGSGGLPVVFVHGNGGDHGVWRASLAHLRATRRAVALDLRGCGGSQPMTTADLSVEAVAGDVGAVADALGLERFVLVAHSYGAAVAEAYAAGHPERVAGLLLVDPAGDVRQADPAALDRHLALLRGPRYPQVSRAALLQGLTGASDTTKQQVLDALAAADPAAFAGCLEGLRHFDPLAALERYRGPRLAILNENRDNDRTSLQNLMPGLPHERVGGVSHWLMLDRPDWFQERLDAFLASLETPGPTH